MSIFKKLLITLMILLAAAGGWYFLYWQNTPAFAAGEIQQAVQKKDWDLFCKRVDVAKVYSYALDDMLAELKADGLPEHAIAASLVKSIKKEVVKELIRQTEIRHLQDRRSGRQSHRLCAAGRQGPCPRLHLAGAAGKRHKRPLDRDTHPEFYRLSERKDGRVTSH